MLFDPLSFSNAGGAVLGVAAYAGLSFFITGPMVGERLIEKAGWTARCPELVRASAAQSRPSLQPRPSLDCAALGHVIGQEGARLCGLVNPLIRGDFIDDGTEALHAFDRGKAERLAAQAADSCECAATLTARELQGDLALHAGTLRLVTPRPVRTLENTLQRSLGAPICAAKG